MTGASGGGGKTGNTLGDEIVAVVEDLYVKDEYRERGIATQLLRKVVKVRRRKLPLSKGFETFYGICQKDFLLSPQSALCAP